MYVCVYDVYEVASCTLKLKKENMYEFLSYTFVYSFNLVLNIYSSF